MIQIYLFLCLIILVLILLSINIKIGNVNIKNDKKKKKICVLKNCNLNNKYPVSNNYRRNVRNEIYNKINNTTCVTDDSLNSVYNKFYLN